MEQDTVASLGNLSKDNSVFPVWLEWPLAGSEGIWYERASGTTKSFSKGSFFPDPVAEWPLANTQGSKKPKGTGGGSAVVTVVASSLFLPLSGLG